MDEMRWEKAAEINGRLGAEMLKSFLEAEGIPVELFQEGAGQVFAVNIGALGVVQVFVPKDRLVEAVPLIEAFENPENEPPSDDGPIEMSAEDENDPEPEP